MSTQTRTYAPEHRHYSPSASVSISGSAIVMAILVVGALIAVAVSFLALGRVGAAEERARISEREVRIAQDDLKYVRSYLSARGISIPANHEEAEQ